MLYELFKNDPYLFIVRFLNGEELAIVHKTIGKRFNVNVNEEAA